MPQSKQKNMRFFENTPEFEEIQKSSEISFLQANTIFLKYHNENKFKKLKPFFYYYQDEFYYFGYETNASKSKENKVWYFMEIKISGKNGKVIIVDEPVENWK